MGINFILLQDENGTVLDEVGDPRNVLSGLLPQGPESAYQYIGDIDMYGDTVFNQSQCVKLLREWLTLRARFRSSDEVGVYEAVRRLLERASTDVHLFVKFEGD